MKKNVLKITFIVISIIVGLCFAIALSLPFIQLKQLNQGTCQMELPTDTLSFTYASTGHILVDVYFPEYDQTYPFVLDCGASNFIFSEHMSKFNFRTKGFSFGIGASGNFFTTKIVGLGDLQIGNASFSGVNGQKIFYPSDCASEAVGLIGTGVMHHLDWQIDFEKQEIILAKGMKHLSFNKDSIQLPISVNPKSNHLKTSIQFRKGAKAHWLLIDIGNSGTLLLKEKDLIADSIAFKEFAIHGKSSKGLGIRKSKVLNEKIVLVDSAFFRKSDFVAFNIPANSIPKSLNLLGLGFFSNYRTTFSWSTKTMVLEPYDSLANYSWKTYGFRMEYDKELQKNIVSAVYDNSSAYEQQVPLYSEVVAIDTFLLADAQAMCNYRSLTETPDQIRLTLMVDSLEVNFFLNKRWVIEP